MLPQRLIESLVGLFLIISGIALTVLAFQVSGLTIFFPKKIILLLQRLMISAD